MNISRAKESREVNPTPRNIFLLKEFNESYKDAKKPSGRVESGPYEAEKLSKVLAIWWGWEIKIEIVGRPW